MTAETIHTCSYSCERPECIRAQRDELAARMTAQQPEARGVVDGFPERYGCNGPQGTFWTDDAELANKLIAATFDRDDWTVTDTHEPGNSDAATRVVSAQLMHWHGLPVYVTGTVVSHPSNWKLIDGERNG